MVFFQKWNPFNYENYVLVCLSAADLGGNSAICKKQELESSGSKKSVDLQAD